ncbi:hypothetical protein [Ekhidna sp.]|uniref:hypothetical protein n=1 Tax=Ekhidna sp. TaxID=2608089 RepID=UPI003BA9FF0E
MDEITIVENLKLEIQKIVSNLKNVEYASFVGRFGYKEVPKLLEVNDLDLYLIVTHFQRFKLKQFVENLELLCNKASREGLIIFPLLIDGPFKPQPKVGSKILLVHIIMDDLTSLKSRYKNSLPTLISFSKYESFNGSFNFKITHSVDAHHLLNSKFGLTNCIKYIRSGYVPMSYYNHSKERFDTLKVDLVGYYFLYFLAYSVFHNCRNFIRYRYSNYEARYTEEVLEFINYSTGLNDLFCDASSILSLMDKIRYSGFYELKDMDSISKTAIRALMTIERSSE